MGEPRPGDIPDPTHLKTANALLKGDEVKSKGGWIFYDTGIDFWKTVIQTAPRLISAKEAMQLQQDIDTTGLTDGVANAAAFANGSWVYALLAGDCLPNSPVVLQVFDDGAGNFPIGIANQVAVEGDISVTSLLATVITDDVHSYKKGDRVTITAASLDETGVAVVITKIVNSTTFEFVTTSSDFTTETAISTYSAIENEHAAGKFIKRSGDTFAQKGVLNEIGVFAMTGVGL